MAQSDLFMGAARIYTGVTVPAANTAMTLTGGVPAGGTDVGLTGGPAIFRVTGTIKEILTEQTLSVAKVRKTTEEVEIEFTLKEVDFSKLQQYINGSTLTVNAVTSPKTRLVNGGGNGCISTAPICLVTKDPCGSTPYYIAAMIYNAYIMDAFEMSFGKETESMLKVKMRGLADTTRPVGDQTYQILQQYA